MADVSELGQQILGLFRGALQSVYAKFSHKDQQDLENYCRQIAQCTIDRRGTTDPAMQAKLEQQIAGFSGAINLMADRYLLMVNHEAERTALEISKAVAEWVLRIIVAVIK